MNVVTKSLPAGGKAVLNVIIRLIGTVFQASYEPYFNTVLFQLSL